MPCSHVRRWPLDLEDRHQACPHTGPTLTTTPPFGEHLPPLRTLHQVSVAKAGLVSSLPARTCVLAAANPVEGHYNRARTVAENLKMSPAMLSRWALTHFCGVTARIID